MFGSNNNVQSTWGQPAQQPQQNTSAFGQPSAFGSGGTFGQTQQPPQANPMFGNLSSAPSTSGTTSGFGAFANNNANNSGTTGSLFGAPKPATAFGAFGGGTTSTFGNTGTSAFGSTASNTTGGGLFGQPAQTNTTGAFGGGGLFGSKPTTGFGANTNTAGAFGTTPSTDTVAPVTTGTSATPFSAFSEKDGNTTNMLQYQSITAMPAYRGSSYEELRVQDYQQGRKTAGGFGQTGFGATPAQPSTSTSTGLFGQPAQQPATNSIFGSGTTFGQPAQPAAAAPSTGFGAFGQPAAQNNPAPVGNSIFGSFGQQQQQQQPATSGFGQPAASNTGTGLFGGGAFGQSNNNQAKPAGFGAFGSTGTTGSTFGGNAFGSNTTQQQQPSTGLFGQNTGAFGASGNNNNAAKPSIFGQPAQPAANTGGIFGQPAQQNQPATGGFGSGGLFGNTNNTQQQNQQQPNQQPSGGLFGSTTTQPATGGGLFGGGGGLFGNNNANNNQQQQNQQPASGGFSMFGQNKPVTPTPATGGLFGSNTFGQSTNNTITNTGTNLFGSTLGQPTTQPATGGSFGLFNKPVTTGIGQSQSQSGGVGSSIFGSSTATNNNTQGSLTASIAQPIGANLPIFSMLPPGPRAVNLDAQPKKKVGFFVDVPTRSPVPRLQLGYTPATTKLRGFASESGMSSSMAFSTGKPNGLALSRNERSGSIGPDGLVGGRSQSPALGSGGRQSVKKLILDKKVEPSDLFARSGSPGLRGSPGKVTFNPAMSQAAREKDVAREAASINALASPSLGRSQGSPVPTPRPAHPHNHFSAHSTNHIIDSKEVNGRAQTEEPGEEDLQEGDYWVKPDLKVLRNAPYTELSSYEGIVVGRVGYGEIHFLEPVDLTGLSKLEQLKGHVVRFDDKECTVYPDSDDADKPSPGTGLNVRAKIILVKCWAVDKATRAPIKDDKHPAAVKHLKRLKNMRDTHFESFDLQEGKWTFTVDHF